MKQWINRQKRPSHRRSLNRLSGNGTRGPSRPGHCRIMSRWRPHWRRRQHSLPLTTRFLHNSPHRCNRLSLNGRSRTSLRAFRHGDRQDSHKQRLHRSRQMCLNISMYRAPGEKSHLRRRASNSLQRNNRPYPMVPGRATGQVPAAGVRRVLSRGGVPVRMVVCRPRCYRALPGSKGVPGSAGVTASRPGEKGFSQSVLLLTG
jgi:hypothetical protein